MFVRKCAVIVETEKLTIDVETLLKGKMTIRNWEFSKLKNEEGKCICVVYIDFGNCSVNQKLISEWFSVPLTNIYNILEIEEKE